MRKTRECRCILSLSSRISAFWDSDYSELASAQNLAPEPPHAQLHVVCQVGCGMWCFGFGRVPAKKTASRPPQMPPRLVQLQSISNAPSLRKYDIYLYSIRKAFDLRLFLPVPRFFW
jgi:hypothetical protein